MTPPKTKVLIDADQHVGNVGVVDHLVPGVGLVDAQQKGGHHIRRPNSQRDGFDRQQGHGQEHGQKTRHHQVIHRMRRQGAQGINLLGHAHRAHSAAMAAPTRPATISPVSTGPSSLPMATAHHRQRRAVHFHPVKLHVTLKAQHHPGEHAGDDDDRLDLTPMKYI
jgi:hypothetical protein